MAKSSRRTKSTGIDWQAIVASLDVSQVLAEQYHRYRLLLQEGLVFFLAHLPQEQQLAIALEQAGLPGTSSTGDRLLRLLHRSPTLHKLGQTVARDQRLAFSLRERLQQLEARQPTTSMEHIRHVLGDLAEQVDLADSPLAEASVAVVVPFTHVAGKGAPSAGKGATSARQGVFKVLKPGVRETLEDELLVWSDLGQYLEERCAVHGLPVIDFAELITNVRDSLARELRLDCEQAHMAQARAFYRQTAGVYVPALFPQWCRADVTAMEYVAGKKITDVYELAADERAGVAERLVAALVARPFFNSDADCLFHADPHAGNILFTETGDIALLDWSLVASLTAAQRQAVMGCVLGALKLDAIQVGEAMKLLSNGKVDDERLQAVVSVGLRRVRYGAFPGFDWLLSLFDAAIEDGAMGLADGPLLFRKALLTTAGVAADVSSSISIDQVAFVNGMAELLGGVGPVSRDNAVHVSGLDLFSLWCAWPMTVTRLWTGCFEDFLAAWRKGLDKRR